MSTLRSIVAATDLSAPSRHAAERAALLAREHGATLTLLHTLSASALDDLRRWLDGTDAAGAALQDDARGRLHAQAAELGQRFGLAVAEVLALGEAVEEVQRHAGRIDADLVVTGTRGAGFFRGVVVGSTAERMARRSSRPVLMVRQAPLRAYRRVLVPVDFSPWSATAVALASRLAPDAELLLMHAVELPFEGRLRTAGVAEHVVNLYRERARREAREQLEALAQAAKLPPHRVGFATPEGADAWMLVVQHEQEHDCDLVAVGRQGRHALGELLLGSTTRMVMAEGSADVLLASAPAQ